MNNNNPRLTKRKQVQLLVILTILAWATQTLMHQWGFSQVVSSAIDLSDMPAATDENSFPTRRIRRRRGLSSFGRKRR